MEKQIPKAVKVEMAANVLKIEFEDGTVKYLRSHLNQEYSETYSLKKGKKANILLAPHNTWLGTEIEVKEDGSVVLNGKDEYTKEELWNDSKDHLSEW